MQNGQPCLYALRKLYMLCCLMLVVSDLTKATCAPIRCSIVVSISACHAEDPGSIPGRGAACTDRAHHNGQLLMQPGLGQRVPCFWVCPPSSAVLGRRRWPQNRTKGQQARAERDGPRLAQICRSRLSCSLGLRAAVALMIPRRAEPLRSGAATCGASPR